MNNPDVNYISEDNVSHTFEPMLFELEGLYHFREVERTLFELGYDYGGSHLLRQQCPSNFTSEIIVTDASGRMFVICDEEVGVTLENGHRKCKLSVGDIVDA